jgi:transcriptional regulator with XRE-family HTH domain
MVSVGERLREERLRLGLKQDELGVAPKTQRFYESDERSPDALYLAAFAKQGGDVRYVVTGVRSSDSMSTEHQSLIDAYEAAPAVLRNAALDVLGSHLKRRDTAA